MKRRASSVEIKFGDFEIFLTDATVDDPSNILEELRDSHVTHHSLRHSIYLAIEGNSITVSHKGARTK